MSTPTAPARRSLRGRILAPALVLACLVGGGMLGTFFLTHPVEESDSPTEEAEHHAVIPSLEEQHGPPAPQSLRSILHDAETSLRSGNYEDALKVLATAHTAEGKADPTAYLKALTLEASGKPVESLAAYRKAADPDRDPATWAASLLGAARSALARGELLLAREYLARVELRSGLPELRSTRVEEECAMIRARLDLAELGTPRDADPLDDTVSVAAPFDLDGPYLDWLTEGWHRSLEELTEITTPKAALPQNFVLKKVNDRVLVSGQLPETRVLELIKELAKSAKWKLRLPVALSPSLSGATVAIAIDGLPATALLAALTEPLGLQWRLEGDTLTIFPLDPHAEIDPTPKAVASLIRATEFLDHPQSRAAAIRLGTLFERTGRKADATARYARILTESPHSSEALLAGYNLGLLQLRTGDPAAARLTFREVIDRGKKGRWTDLGWWWTGRTYLDECDPAHALKPLRVALAGKDRSARSAATLGIVLCHMLQGDDVAAYETLQRNILGSRDDFARLGQLFDAILRHSETPSDLRAEALYEAVSATDGGRRLGPAGTYLIGRVYRDLGYTARTVVLYERVMATGGPWAPRMTFAVGEILDEQDRIDEARQNFLAVAAVDNGSLGTRSEMHLVDLELRAGRAKEALARCRRLIKRPAADESALLLMMGRAYELLDEPLQAAACFAGRKPTD